jgi:SAM-dependent methyltransferase
MAADFDRLKAGAKWMWGLGDYGEIAPLLEVHSSRLAAAAVLPGQKVLDVAAGTGNFALAAADRGASVTACDFSPHMLELGRSRSEAAGKTVDWREGDAEELPFPDESFDVVASVFGAMFAPRPDRVASELFRVCRPGGLVAMANYGPDGFLGSLAQLLTSFSAPSPLNLPSPFDWGTRAEVERRFAGLAARLVFEPDIVVMRFASVADGLAFWERTNGPQIALRTLLTADRYAEFRSQVERLMSAMNQSSTGALELSSECLRVLARR